MARIKRYDDIRQLVEKIDKAFTDKDEKQKAILMMNELEALRNAQETTAAKSTLKHVIERCVEGGKVSRRVAIYNADEIDADSARDEVAVGKIREKSFIVVPQESVAGRFWTEKKYTPKKTEEE